MLNGKKVVLGVSGGIAAYKACALTSKLVQQGADVKVIMTEGATAFVQPLTFQALSRNPVYTDAFDEKNPEKIAHIDLADWADLVILAPATAHLLGRIVNGLADDMLTTTLLACTAPVYIAPAMNVHMYRHPAVKKNLIELEEMGYRFIEPGDGYLACGYVGKGRLEEPERIIEVIDSTEKKSEWMKGKKVLITAGPTQEVIDPVRFFTNHSSGKMGFALARAAVNLGAEVTLVSGPVELEAIAGVRTIPVQSAQDMYETVMAEFEGKDLVIKSAAVADYRPKESHQQKMKKQDGDLVVEMERTTDILQELGDSKTSQFLVGFAAETENLSKNGQEKLKKKNLDAIVVNEIGSSKGFKSEYNEVTVYHKNGEERTFPYLTKIEIAEQLLDLFHQKMEEKS